MHNFATLTPVLRVARAAQAARRVTVDGERGNNEQIKELLRAYGLRTSLIRLKVIDTLYAAALQGRTIGVRGVHAQLADLDVPLSFLSVREVLKRLCAENLISLASDKTYCLQPQARALLER